MKTHDIAAALKALIRQQGNVAGSAAGKPAEPIAAIDALVALLLQGPNIPLSEAEITKRTDDIAVGLRVLSSLSRYTKQQWLALVQDYGMSIEQNPRDSARDVLGKVLRYLEAHPEVVRALGTKTRRKKVDTSELENALTKLLERKDD